MKGGWIVFLVILVLVIISGIIFFNYISKPVEEKVSVNETTFQLEILIENLDTPWAIDFLPDGRMIFTERGGLLSIFDGNKKIISKLPAQEISESGLLGVAVDPEFEKNNFIYIYYTYQEGDDIWNRVSRFSFNNQTFDETILLDRIPGARIHDGGRIKFGPDNKLYATTGDAGMQSFSQDKNSLAGKILRMEKDGSIPPDNPFGNYVYSYGHRNPQGLAWHPATGELYASEHGPSGNDEINVIVKGRNYGWPETCSDTPQNPEHVNAVRCYTKFTLAPSGIAFHNNELYLACLRGSQLRRIIFDYDNQTILNEQELFSDLGRIREAVEHNGYIYIATNNRDGRGIPKIGDDKIIRIKAS